MKDEDSKRRIVTGRDETATRDIGGAYAGRAGTMADDSMKRDAGKGDGVQSRTPPPQTGGAGDHPTASTDTSRAPRDVEAHLGGYWTGDTEPDKEYRENPPTRGGDNDPPANDAF